MNEKEQKKVEQQQRYEKSKWLEKMKRETGDMKIELDYYKTISDLRGIKKVVLGEDKLINDSKYIGILEAMDYLKLDEVKQQEVLVALGFLAPSPVEDKDLPGGLKEEVAKTSQLEVVANGEEGKEQGE